MNNPLAKVYLNENGDLVCEALVKESIDDGIYLSGPCKTEDGRDTFRIGVSVIDPKNNVAITKDAIPVLKKLIDNSLCDGGGGGDISWNVYSEYSSFGWFGDNKRVFKNDEQVYRASGTHYRENYISVID